MLPIDVTYLFTGADLKEYMVHIHVSETTSFELFPEGISATFKLFSLDDISRSKKRVYLIDNHAPFSFHEHPSLSHDHENHQSLHVITWKEAWNLFQKKCRDLTK